MPRLALLLVAAMFGLLSGCAQMMAMSDHAIPPTTQPSQADIVGTWRFVRVTAGSTGKAYPYFVPFYCRFYTDGTAASWPTPIAPQDRKSSTVAPSSIFSNSASTGRRVPLKTHAPLTLSGDLSTAGHVFQSSMAVTISVGLLKFQRRVV